VMRMMRFLRDMVTSTASSPDMVGKLRRLIAGM
jgi:hypothetical protein